ncbi:SSL2 DNA or RNA helicases of superfamily II [uncultured Caudovirales phage]|uniref:SSL2 DNA or RNA helicases of superfamily II n=1 Tax=uncultured Caudovirales phage TaxID=2100421 RepID=A0A6J7WHM0_9CAUD|nr:SSL2 DNA or RNA helicases of superfamily II [uncultured Caudovirales phage]
MQARLIIRDEVNVKIEGLDLTDRTALVKKFKYEIPGARYQPSVRLGRWDGKVAFFQLGGSTYINLLDAILPHLEDRGYDVEVEDTRDYKTNFEFAEIKEDTFSNINWPKGHPQAGQPIVLRDYQPQILNNFLANPQSIQEVATGAGKTIMTAALSKTVEPYGRSIIIVPNKSLVTQTEADYVNLGLDVGVYFGDRKEWGKTHTICTWQSLNILLKNTQAGTADITIGEFIEDVVCVIIDETHMAKADALKTLLTGVFAKVPIRWGLTGTIPKEDYERVSLLCSIGPVVGKLSASELQEAGHLANCHVNIVQLQDFVEYKDYQSELKYLVTTPERIAYLAKMVDKIKEGGNTLILVDRIETGKILQAELSTLFSLLSDKPDVAFVSGATKAGDRKDEYDDIATSTNKIIIATYGVAAVGINIPRIFNLVLIEPGKSFVRVIQSIGRGIRKAEDKDFVQIWDITSTCKFAKRHLTKRKQFYKEANYPFTIEKTAWQ